MKFSTSFILLAASLSEIASAAVIFASVPATTTTEAVTTNHDQSISTPTPAIERRNPIEDEEITTTAAQLKPWLRTHVLETTTVVELITPTVWEGVTFAAQPKSNLKIAPPWLSLEKNGRIKTITPKTKNGITQNASPEYGTWFQEEVTKTINLKTVDGIKEDKIHEEIVFVEEDTADRLLNPIIRCTPERYFKKKRRPYNVMSDPFCTPKEGVNLIMDEVYWVTWYTKYFQDAEKVRLHLAYIEKNKYGHVGKRDLIPSEQQGLLHKRDSEDAFWSSEWIPNLDGVYPLRILDEFFIDAPVHDVMLTIQPDTVEDEDFNLVNGTYVKIYRQSLKVKTSQKLKVEQSNNDNALYVAMTIPTIMVVVFCGYAIVNYYFKDNRTWKKVRARSKRKIWSDPRYKRLPSNTYELS